MNLQTGTIEITGLSPEMLQTLDRKAKDADTTAEEYLRTLIEQECAYLTFSPSQLETLRQEVQLGRDQIAQGRFRVYDSADAMMDDIEAQIAKRAAQGKNGSPQ